MPRSEFLQNIEKLQRIGMALSQQLVDWTEPHHRRSLTDRMAREASGMASELATLLLAPGGYQLPREELDRRIAHLLSNENLSEFGTDPFGFAPERMRGIVPILEFMYRVWFRVEAHDIHRVPSGRCLIVGNHSGQLPFDGAMIGAGLFLDRDPPRMMRSMVEKFATSLPFFGEFILRCGQVTGLPDNARRLLEAEECVVVFPEGARGVSKPFRDRYRMTPFGHGFMRLALRTDTPIVPVAVVGAEEQTLQLFDFHWLAKALRSPAMPITPLTPLLGPLSLVPSPVKYRIYYGEPLRFEGDPDDDEAVIASKVAEVRGSIQRMLDRGLAERKGWFI
jgi:1-acyl-sn-glycerol-3-phosphate acyltransferase